MKKKTIPDFVEQIVKHVEGKNDKNNILAFTLSTCQWCKKCKRYLDNKEIKYRYVDVDQINSENKGQILEFLKENYETRISYPFIICDDKFIVGFDPKKYDEMFGAGED
ncbi:MAG: glutaredoxin family protein [Candidatus Lokiarchaeota archaeon]|nr:glutaredoxin family protein [Candidatus Lokiarchaeota archaeon]